MSDRSFEDRNTAFTFNFDSSNFVIPEPEKISEQDLSGLETSMEDAKEFVELKDLTDDELQ